MLNNCESREMLLKDKRDKREMIQFIFKEHYWSKDSTRTKKAHIRPTEKVGHAFPYPSPGEFKSGSNVSR